ncbi:AraC family transcriptional regulator of adaptative response / methylphosphotriester-DNA alkyltransferase methyltransferase [Neobacillus bataviensis]|uniref:AraC family transcriptional regulator of adaptative response / methylphosphotriester-DNA alkyltransferase methyltransferase n=1 Tax=Neobacillus bataviensis TaxID=220685 RepID=A0A561CR62_9BACI|nr:bifunctional transcriptional activator/DNA repair enzyme AdaA [Neobacillus bataviensis]TWD93719.1 AraC family transcriptional regulator of adaptative response / methylphosphotriester-DNA alkyltransferase methyltransferase [Neobacillus bataviensis]
MSAQKGFDNGMITAEKWQAIIENDAAYNDLFFYAVKTTGIFCKPSCKSRVPKKDNVRIFQSAEEALAANFRPCKRCMPTEPNLPDQEWIHSITNFINKNYHSKLTLETLAEISHGSPYHLQRTFKKVKGMTPVEYIQDVRIIKAKELLIKSDRAVTEISRMVGIPNTPYFITLYKKKTGETPAQYRQSKCNTEESESEITD